MQALTLSQSGADSVLFDRIPESARRCDVTVWYLLCRARLWSKFKVHYALPHRGWQHTHTHTQSTNKHKQDSKVFHSLVSAMATKGATHPTTETVNVFPSSTMTQESGEECTGRYNLELPADLSATWAEEATHPDHDTSDDSNREYCAMPSAHV